ncbi:MAG: hypothetical protein Rhirs2KO_12610 [Rhizobiaceae bacterium]
MSRVSTLSDVARMGCQIWANCCGQNCGHGAKLDLEKLIERFGPDCPVSRPGGFLSRMRCTRCGHLGASPTLTPNGQDVTQLQHRGYFRWSAPSQ